MAESETLCAVNELKKKLECFTVEIDNIQNFNKKLMIGLAASAHKDTSISQTLSLFTPLDFLNLPQPNHTIFSEE